MGLQSALTTALTGLQAAETTIDVAGNNVANSSTDGFKQSHVLFANQFYQTQSIGSQPTDQTGGTNPRQIGLGVKVAAINPDFSQGTIQVSSNPLDVAIQGDGFLIVQGAGGQQYTRNGQLQTNSKNQLVTSTGQLVLGQAADKNFNIDSNSALVPLTIPLGSQSVAQATKTANLSGVLSPTADVGTAGVTTSAPLGDATVEFPVNDSATTPTKFDAHDFQVVSPPDTTASVGTPQTTGGTLAAGAHEYKVVWFTNATAATKASESAASATIPVTTTGTTGSVDFTNLPVDLSANPIWDGRRIYRSDDGGTTFNLAATINDTTTATVSDTGTTGAALDTNVLAQEPYSYYVTFTNAAHTLESRPTELIGPFQVSDTTSKIRIDNLPQPTDPAFNKINIYRNTGANQSDFRLVDQVDPGVKTYIDESSDASIAGAQKLDLLGVRAATTTKLTDVVIRDGDTYTQPFVQGTLSFTGTRGGRELDAKTFDITATSTVGDLEKFMTQAFGIDTDSTAIGASAGSITLSNGQIIVQSNKGTENSLGVDLTSFSLKPAASGSTATSIPLRFDSTTNATGTGSTTDFVVFDKLGTPINVRLTTVVETKTEDAVTTYRWFATSEDNQPATPASGIKNVNTLLDSGTITFNAEGKIIDPTDGKAVIGILHPASDPLKVTVDFSQISGLDQKDSLGNSISIVNLNQQDGFPPGSLTSATITESGIIRGVFSNGAERSLGQLRMARFNNATGLIQDGNNVYSEGINSGAAIVGNPGDNGNGTLTSGAVELSNSDIGQNLIDLILASTQYRGGARVITTAQQLFDELLNLRR
jgi:flagellar hook protein FlgE